MYIAGYMVTGFLVAGCYASLGLRNRIVVSLFAFIGVAFASIAPRAVTEDR